jgi:8-oxo-dGTP pyrophosphatase MutT (NUDIX family)
LTCTADAHLYWWAVARLAVKLLLLDEEGRLLLINSKDPQSQAECWYPVGGGIEPGETLQDAAAREAYEETGLADLPTGLPVWWRDHTYEFDGRVVEVHEKWLMHTVERFEPAPADLSDYEARTILGFRWWSAQDLVAATETIFPPRLGHLLTDLLTVGAPAEPYDITDSRAPATDSPA